MNIAGRMVTLRAMEKSDCEMIREMFNDPEIENLVVGWSLPVSSYAQERWFEAHYGDSLNLRFVIETPMDGAVGIITLTDIDWKNRRASHGIKLSGKERRSRGIGTDAVMAVMRYAFDELGLNRLDGSWFDDNEASKSLYTKCGWHVEGVRRQYVFKRGKFRDLSVVGILASEYYELIQRNHYWDNPPDSKKASESSGGVIWKHTNYIMVCLKRLEDKKRAIEICDNAFRKPITGRGDFELWLRKWDTAADFILAYGNETLGYAIVYANDVTSKTAFITMIAVRPEYQRRNIGKDLLLAVQKLAGERGMRELELEVKTDNRNAIGFYEKNGFCRKEKTGNESMYMVKKLHRGESE